VSPEALQQIIRLKHKKSYQNFNYADTVYHSYCIFIFKIISHDTALKFQVLAYLFVFFNYSLCSLILFAAYLKGDAAQRTIYNTNHIMQCMMIVQ